MDFQAHEVRDTLRPISVAARWEGNNSRVGVYDDPRIPGYLRRFTVCESGDLRLDAADEP